MNSFKLNREVDSHKKELNDVYYGDKVLMVSYPMFNQKLKEEEAENNEEPMPNSVSKFYYDNQQVKQVFKPYENIPYRNHIVAFYPFEKVYLDTMYLRLGNSTIAFINVIDLFSKYALSRMFIIGKTSQAVPSSNSVKVFNDFLDETKKWGTIGYVITDRGSEFMKDFFAMLNEKQILHVYANAGDKRKTSPIERFNKTLRLYIEKYRSYYGRLDNKALQKIVESYNNQPHAFLKYSPIQILNDKNIQTQVEQQYIDLQKESDVIILPDGTPVRYLLDRSPFQKIKPVWSKDVFKVESYSHSNYELGKVEGFFKRNQLQVVNPEFIM